MSNMRLSIALPADLDRYEIARCIPEDELSFETNSLPARPGTSHEPFTIVAVILVSAQALAGIAAWMLKKRTRGTVTTVTDIEWPDGKKEKRTVTVELKSSTTQAEVLEALGQQLPLNPDVLGAALELA